MSKTTKARKGDLLLVEIVETNYWSMGARAEARAQGRTLPETTTTYSFGLVDSATREGEVKTWRRVGYGADQVMGGYAQPIGNSRRWVMPAKQIDITGALSAAKAHHWPGHQDQPKPFGTFDEAKAAVRPFLTAAVRS